MGRCGSDRGCLRASRRRRRSSSCASAGTRRARSTSRPGSGWSTRGPRSSGSSRGGIGSLLSVHAPIAGFMGHVEKRPQARDGDGHARPLGRDREGGRRRARRLPPGLPARPDPEADDLLGRLAARRPSQAARGQGARRPVRRRDHGPRQRLRQPRRRDRDLVPPGLGAAGDRLRAPARDHRRRVHDGEGVPRRPRRREPRPPARRAVPHPLLRHRLREPKRDEAPPVRRGHAARRADGEGAGPLPPPGDRDHRVAERGVTSGDSRRALRGVEKRLAPPLQGSRLVVATASRRN